MNPDCCGDKCRECRHCASQSCATCPCCHAGATAACHSLDTAVALPEGASPEALAMAEGLEAEPLIQIVPSPFNTTGEVIEWAADDSADDPPLVQVVPSPLRAAADAAMENYAGEAAVEAHAGEAAGEAFAGDAAVEAFAADAVQSLVERAEQAAASWPHAVDAAEALIDEGVTDCSEFVARGLAAAGQAWTEGESVASLFDDLVGRTTPERRERAAALFDIVGQPGHRPRQSLQSGDLMLRRGEQGQAHAAVLTHPQLYSRHDAQAQGLQTEGPWPGLYAHVVEPGARPHGITQRFARRIAAADGSLRPDTLLLRARGSDEASFGGGFSGGVAGGVAGGVSGGLSGGLSAAGSVGLNFGAGYGGAPAYSPPPVPSYPAPAPYPPRPFGYPAPTPAAPRTPTYPPPRPYPHPPPPPPLYSSCRTLDAFGYDSATLSYGHRAAISELAQQLVAAGATAVRITGHASPEGTLSYNLALGQRRADAVAQALREAVEGRRAGAAAVIAWDAQSEGEARQVSTQASANRRVEVCWGRTEPQPPYPTPPGPRRPPGPGPRPRPPPPPATRVLTRYDAESPSGRAMFGRFEEAVRRMMARPASDPLSWTFQWYIHAVRGDRTRDAELRAVFAAGASPARALAERAWETCEPHFDSRRQIFFLPWHRMYLDHFERICRRVLGDDSFTLPYWNYASGSAVLPAPFRNPASPLFRSDRNAGPNQGRAIDEGQPRGTVSASRALAIRVFDAPGNAPGFSDTVERDPHDTVHGLIGNLRGMGSVTWAAGDPIFWLHHCNIDRLWASWTAAGGRNPTDAAWLNRSYTFADATGAAVQAVVREHNDVAQRGLRYERLEMVPARSGESFDSGGDDDAPRRARRSTMARHSTAAPAGGIPLGANAIKVNLRQRPQGPAEAQEAGAAGKVYLVLRNYRANVQPGVIYHVYLGLPAGTTGQAAQRHYVGPLSFFGAVAHQGHAGHFEGRTARFDVTAIAARLRSAGALAAAPSVTIAPAGAPAAQAQPVIGEISLVEE